MMCKVLDHQHAARFAFDFHPAADTLKSSHGAFDCFAFDAASVRNCDCSESVQHIVPARDWRANARDFAAFIHNAEFRRVVVPQNIARAPIALGREAKGLHRAECFRSR